MWIMTQHAIAIVKAWSVWFVSHISNNKEQSPFRKIFSWGWHLSSLISVHAKLFPVCEIEIALDDGLHGESGSQCWLQNISNSNVHRNEVARRPELTKNAK